MTFRPVLDGFRRKCFSGEGLRRVAAARSPVVLGHRVPLNAPLQGSLHTSRIRVRARAALETVPGSFCRASLNVAIGTPPVKQFCIPHINHGLSGRCEDAVSGGMGNLGDIYPPWFGRRVGPVHRWLSPLRGLRDLLGPSTRGSRS